MRNLISAELLKLRTTRAFWAYVASIVVFVPITIALSITVGNDQNPLTTSDGIRGVFSAASSGGLMAVLLGITMSAGEFRNHTATPTFLITPDRRRVVAAKVLAGGILGLVLAAVSAVLTVAVATPWLQAHNIDVHLLSADVITPIAGALLSLPLGVIFGIGIGGMIHNQTIAITVIVVWTSIIETFLTGFVPEVGRWLPTGAASALGGTWTSEGRLLPFWAAALVLTAYCASAAAAGTHLTTRKDMT
ncbi:MAG: ABC transporter permease [Acidimicrobiales bacterium]